MCRSKYGDVGKQVSLLSFFGLLLTTAEGANPAAVDIEGKTPLHWTIGNTEPSCVKVLYQAYPAMVNLRWVSSHVWSQAEFLSYVFLSNRAVHILSEVTEMTFFRLPFNWVLFSKKFYKTQAYCTANTVTNLDPHRLWSGTVNPNDL